MKSITFTLTFFILSIFVLSCDNDKCACKYYENCLNGECVCLEGYSKLGDRCVEKTRSYSYLTRYVYQVVEYPSGYSNYENSIFTFISEDSADLRLRLINSTNFYTPYQSIKLYKWDYLDQANPTEFALNISSSYERCNIDSNGYMYFPMEYGYSYNPNEDFNKVFFKKYDLGPNERLLLRIKAVAPGSFDTMYLVFEMFKDINGDNVEDEFVEKYVVKYAMR